MDHHHQQQEPVVVVMIPLPAQGHLNQLLHFSCLISTRAGLPVYFTGSASHNRQAKSRIQGWDPSTISNIYFHDLPLPPFETPSPDHNAADKFPAHFQPTFEVTLHLRDPLSKLLSSLSTTSKRVIVIHDSLMLFAAQEASLIANGEAYCFNSCSIFSLLFHKWEMLGKPITDNMQTLRKFPPYTGVGLFPDSFMELLYKQAEFGKFDSGDLYNTSEAIEGEFMNLLDQEPFSLHRKHWVVGPFNPITLTASDGSSNTRHDSLEWLDQQPAKSVLYVSFGTAVSLSDEEIKELAIGLEGSGQRFIWVLRGADRGDIFAGDEARRFELPEGYEDRLKNRGVIVRGWAPQLEILAHESTGGFMSHCGWNSCMESLSMGVPIAAWPMHSDQPWNSWLVTEVLKVGFLIREWEKRKELVPSSVIRSVASKLMESSEGNEIRSRAEATGHKVRQSMKEGGTSIQQLDAFFNHITRA